jgi:hypothetical protein
VAVVYLVEVEETFSTVDLLNVLLDVVRFSISHSGKGNPIGLWKRDRIIILR